MGKTQIHHVRTKILKDMGLVIDTRDGVALGICIGRMADGVAGVAGGAHEGAV